MNAVSALGAHTGYTLLSFRRNGAATFFTVVFPLVLFVLLTAIIGDPEINRYLVPGLLTLALVSATLGNLAIGVTIRRERGMLKRLRGSPLPTWTFVCGEFVVVFMITALMAFLMIGIGWLLFNVEVRDGGWPSLGVSLVVPVMAFAPLGLALSTIIPSVNAAPAVTNVIVLPLYFVSDVFLAGQDMPAALTFVGDLFPIKHTSNALFASFDQSVVGFAPQWNHWAVIAGWGLFGVVVALWRFEWLPRR